MSRFRIRSTRLFLTYPKCPILPAEALAQVSRVVSPTGWIVAKEKHADGTDHLHVYLESTEPMVVVSATALDLKNEETTYHGNYQAARSRNAVKKYVQKDGEFISNIDTPTTKENPWKRAREVATTEGLAAALEVLSEDPTTARDLCINGDRITRNLQALTKKRFKITYDLSAFSFPEIWDMTSSTLLITGPTNIGKTSLAKALLPEALFTRHIDRLREYGSGQYSGIILDDMSFLHLHREAQIALLDRADDTDIHIRYGVASIPAGTPVIITTNSRPDEVFTTTDGAINRRLTIVEMSAVGIYNKLN